MNYYKRHLGDYAKDTRHLSLAEHGAYCLLLDYYYSTEKPIRDDRCERIANAYTDDERKAVRSVLESFFTLTEEGWLNRRADVEISEFHDKSLKAKAAAAARWSGRNADASETHSDPHSGRNASHKPLAISQKEPKSLGAPKRPPTGSRLEDDWSPPADWVEWAKDERPDLDVILEVDKFRDFWISKPGKDGRKANWKATWRNWIRNARGPVNFRGQSQPAGYQPLPGEV